MCNQIGIVILPMISMFHTAFSFSVDRCCLYRILRVVFCRRTPPIFCLVGKLKLYAAGVFRPGLSVAAAAEPAALSEACRRFLVLWPAAPRSVAGAVPASGRAVLVLPRWLLWRCETPYM